MKKLSLLCAMALVLAGLGVSQVYATDITIPDTIINGTLGGWYNQPITASNPAGEDQETESPPNTRTGQIWDLEAFLRTGTNLSMVGGYNFATGVNGYAAAPGDVFIDNITAAHPDSPLYGTGITSTSATNIYKYNYALTYSVSGNGGTWTLYQIDATTATKEVADIKPQSDPWKLGTGGTQTLLATGSLAFSGPLTAAQTQTLTGYLFADHASGVYDDSYNHYILTFVGLGTSLPGWTNDPNFAAYFHYTMECGNDSMMGLANGVSVPLPPSALLLGTGLVGLVGLGWRRRKTDV